MARTAATMTCAAVLDNDVQIDNLCECVRILGGEPVQNHNVVEVTAPYPSELASHLLLLYENYWRHEVTISHP